VVLGTGAVALEGSEEGRQHGLAGLSGPGASVKASERHGTCRGLSLVG
jgi:hypothetical protein